jgi:hypothetical protein
MLAVTGDGWWNERRRTENVPDFTSPDFTSPDFTSPDFTSPDFTSPDFNETGRPRGLHGPTPAEAWDEGQRIAVEEREAFGRTVLHREKDASGIEKGPREAAALRRAAIGQALVALVYRREGRTGQRGSQVTAGKAGVIMPCSQSRVPGGVTS